MTHIFNGIPKKQETEPKKPIEFLYAVDADSAKIINVGHSPCDFDHVMLIANDGKFDVMYTYNEDYEHSGIVCLGHWNDGVQE